MMIGGFQESSLLDYPGKIAAIIWTTGCNFRCPFCYNPDLVFNRTDHIPVENILQFLKTRIGKLDAVSISGGEPFIQHDLKSLISTVKDLGFLVKIDTNGTFPDALNTLIEQDLVDYVSMDIKAPKKRYEEIVRMPVDIGLIESSIQIIKKSAKDYEFKTTLIPRYHSQQDIVDIAKWIKGSKRYFLQQFKTDAPLLLPTLSSEKPYKKSELIRFCQMVKSYFKQCELRGI